MGATVGELTVARAEEIARGLTAEDHEVRERAWREVDQLTRFGLRMGEQFLDLAKDRVSAEVRTRSADVLDRLLERLGDVLSAEPEEGGSSWGHEPAPVGAAGRPAPLPEDLEPSASEEWGAATRPGSPTRRTDDGQHDKKHRPRKASKKLHKDRSEKKRRERTATGTAMAGSEAAASSDSDEPAARAEKSPGPRPHKKDKDTKVDKTNKSKAKTKGKEKGPVQTTETPPFRGLALAREPGSDASP